MVLSIIVNMSFEPSIIPVVQLMDGRYGIINYTSSTNKLLNVLHIFKLSKLSFQTWIFLKWPWAYIIC